MSRDMSVCAIRSPTRRAQKLAAPVVLYRRHQSSVRRYGSLPRSTTHGTETLLLTSLTDFANKIGDQRRPAAALCVRPEGRSLSEALWFHINSLQQ